MAQIPNAEFQAGRFVGEDPADGIVAVVAGDGSVQILNDFNTATGDVTYYAPAGTNGGGGTRLHKFDGAVQVNTGTRAVPVYSDVITSAGGTITGTLGIGAAVAAGVHLLVSKASDAAGVGAPTFRLRNTLNSSGWTTTAPWAKIEAYSDDATAPGAGVRSYIGWRFREAAGQSTIIDFHTSDLNNALYPVVSIDAGTVTLQRFNNTVGVAARFVGRRAMGDSGAPTMFTASGRTIATLEGAGYVTTGATYVTGASIALESDAAWTDGSSYPTRIMFSTIASGSTTLTERWRIRSAGHLTPGVDNAYDIGANAAERPRNVYVAGTLSVAGATTMTGNINLTGRIVSSMSDTVIARMLNSAGVADTRQWDFRIQNDGTFEIRSVSDGGTTVQTPITIQHASGAIALNGNITSTITHTGATANIANPAGATGTLNVGAADATAALISIRVAAAARGQLIYRTGTTLRWSVYKSETAEGGANAGSNFVIAAYDDAGTNIDLPISITRAAGGSITLARPLNGTALTSVLVSTATTGTLQIGSGTGSGTSSIQLRAAAGQQSRFDLMTAGVVRWAIVRNSDAESGANAGSPFLINAYDDAGAYVDTPITIIRASSGAISFARTFSARNIIATTDNASDIGASGANRFRDLWLARNADVQGTLNIVGNISHSSASANLAQSTTTATVNVGTGSGSGISQVRVLAASGQTGQVAFLGAGTSLNRWILGKSGTAEGGANAGSNFFLSAYDDAGALIDTVISINRAAAGQVTIARPVGINGAAATSRDLNFATSGTNRWTVRTDNAAEAGADAGSGWQLVARTDAGVFIDNVINVVRAAGGQMTLSRPTVFTSSARVDDGGDSAAIADGATLDIDIQTTGCTLLAIHSRQNGNAVNFTSRLYAIVGRAAQGYTITQLSTKDGTAAMTFTLAQVGVTAVVRFTNTSGSSAIVSRSVWIR